MKKYKVNITCILLAITTMMIFAGCQPTSANNSNMSTTNNTKGSEKSDDTKDKVISSPLIGAWQHAEAATEDVGERSDLYVFNKDGTFSYVTTGVVGIHRETYIKDGYFEIVENGQSSYKITIYDIDINADNPKQNMQKASKGYGILVGIKDNNTIQVTTEGDARLTEYKRINPDLAKSMVSNSIFAEKGLKAVNVTKDYLNNHKEDQPYISFRYSGTQDYRTIRYYTFAVKYKDGTESTLYVTAEDLRLFTQAEYDALQ